MAYNFKNADALFDYIINLPLPQTYKTPDSLKKTYQGVLNSQNAYSSQINNAIKQYGAYTPVANSSTYQKLAAMYDQEYQKNAALAAAETVKASQAMNAGYGDSYSKAASDQAYNNYMAVRGAAVPGLLSSAASAYHGDKDALANSINAMMNQRSLLTGAAKNIYGSKLSDYQTTLKAKQTAADTRQSSLLDLYNYQKSLETAASSGGSSGGGRRRKSSYYNTQKTTQKQKEPTNNGDSLYSAAYNAGGTGLMTQREFARRQRTSKTYSKYKNYAEYVEDMMTNYYHK